MSFEELVGDNGDYDPPAGYPAPDTSGATHAGASEARRPIRRYALIGNA